MRRFRLLAALVAVSTSTAPQQGGRGANPLARYLSADTAIMAIRNVRVIDGTGAPSKANQTLVIRSGVIAAVGDAAVTAIPPGALVIEGSGKSVIPGLVMVHEHFSYPVGSIAAWYGESFTRLFLAGGVTSIRTAGAFNGYADIAMKQQIDRGLKPGPWIDATAPFLQGAGGPPTAMYVLADADDARRMVSFWADAGATSFKAYTHITRAQLRAAIEEAHKRGLKVTGHLCSVTFREAAELGIDNLEHGFFGPTDFIPNKQPDVCPGVFGNPGGQAVTSLDTSSSEFKSLVRLLVDRKVALTSTLPVFESTTPGRPMPTGIEVLTSQLREQYESSFALVQRYPASLNARLYPKAAAMEVAFLRAGGLLIAGTDPSGGQGGIIPGFANQREVELLVDAGLTPLEALKVATLNGATFLNRADRVGSIAVGKQADLVLLAGDPSARIAEIRNVELVFKDGKAFDPAKLIQSVKGWVGIY